MVNTSTREIWCVIEQYVDIICGGEVGTLFEVVV